MNEMTNDAAVAYKFQDRLADGTWQDQYWHRLPPWEHRNPEPLYSATTVAELRARAELAERQVAACKSVLVRWNTVIKFAEEIGYTPEETEVMTYMAQELAIAGAEAALTKE